MAYISVSNTFTNGTSADATQVNTNFTDIINGLSDGTKSLTMDQATFGGAVIFNGAVTLGNGVGDDITITGSLAASIPIKTNNSFDIGAATLGLAGIYLGAPSSRTTRITANQSLSGSNTLVLPNGNGNSFDSMISDGSGNLSFYATQNFSTLISNIGFTSVMAANACTITLKQSDSATTLNTGSNSARIGFRSATLTSGATSIVNITSEISLTITSGASIGTIDATACRVYVYLLDNAGVAELAVCSRKLDESIIYTSVAISSASDSDNILYSTTARSNVAIRCIGSFVSTQTTAGTWASAATSIYTGTQNILIETVPVGSVHAMATATVPGGFLFCNGAAVSRLTYASLFGTIGTIHGTGDGSTTFNVPDYRGRFLRGFDNGAGRDPDTAGRTAMNTGGNTGDNVGSVQTSDYLAHTHSINGANCVDEGGSSWRRLTSGGSLGGYREPASSGGNETRPVNATVKYVIKY